MKKLKILALVVSISAFSFAQSVSSTINIPTHSIQLQRLDTAFLKQNLFH